MNGQRIGLIRMIENSLRQQIKKGVYPSGSTLPPYRDLARTYNVSLATVQQAVKKLAVDGLLEVYQGRGAVVRGETWLWRPGSINHRVPEQERQIGLFLRSVYQGYNSQTIQDYVQGIADELANWHMSLLLYLHPEDPEEMLSFCLEKIRQRSVVGFILWSLNSRVDREILKTVHRLHLPFVLLNVKEPGALGNKAHYVMADEAAGISQAIDFLFRIGHRKIGYVGRISGSLRYRLYLAAMKKNGVTPEKTWLCQVEKDDEDVPAESLLRAKQRPTAFFCDTDFKAANLMEKARVTELLVPEELSVIGFDDIPLAVRTKPALTTVYKPRYEMGREAGRMLACLLNGRDTAITRKRVLKTYLVHRESCAPPATLWQDYLPGRKKWEGKELLVQAVPVSR